MLRLLPKKIDIYIDDGCHTDDCILATLANMLPAMNPGAIGLIEDNGKVWRKIRARYPALGVEGPFNKELTVLRVPASGGASTADARSR